MDIVYNLISGVEGPIAYGAVLGLLLLSGLGMPLPEDVTLFAGALLAYYEKADVHLMVMVSLVGVMVGDSFVFFMGARYGRQLLTHRWVAKILHAERLGRIQDEFHKHGAKILFAARFMPGLRTPTFFSAGMMHIPYSRLLIYDGGAALLSVPAIIYVVYFFGSEVDRVIGYIRNIENAIALTILGVILLVLGRWLYSRWKQKRELSRDA